MTKRFKNPFFVFAICFITIALPLFTLPINFFQGEIVYAQGLMVKKVEAPISLSYFIGLGYSELDMTGVKEFYLTAKGYILALILLFGVPGLIAYRIYLGKNSQDNDSLKTID
jgi:hypothetical protein